MTESSIIHSHSLILVGLESCIFWFFLCLLLLISRCRLCFAVTLLYVSSCPSLAFKSLITILISLFFNWSHWLLPQFGKTNPYQHHLTPLLVHTFITDGLARFCFYLYCTYPFICNLKIKNIISYFFLRESAPTYPCFHSSFPQQNEIFHFCAHIFVVPSSCLCSWNI